MPAALAYARAALDAGAWNPSVAEVLLMLQDDWRPLSHELLKLVAEHAAK